MSLVSINAILAKWLWHLFMEYGTKLLRVIMVHTLLSEWLSIVLNGPVKTLGKLLPLIFPLFLLVLDVLWRTSLVFTFAGLLGG